MRGGRAQKGEAKVELHRTHPGHVDKRPDATCGRQPASRPPIQVRGGEVEQVETVEGRRREQVVVTLSGKLSCPDDSPQ